MSLLPGAATCCAAMPNRPARMPRHGPHCWLGLERKLTQGDKALVGNAGYCRFLTDPAGDGFTIDAAKVKADARFDGLFVLRTICGRPLRCKLNLREETACRLGADICPASDAAIHLPRARMGVRGSGPNQRGVLKAH